MFAIDLPSTIARNTVGMIFGSAAGANGFTFSGSGATPGFQIRAGGTANGIINNDADTQTFNVPITLFSNTGASGSAAAQTWNAASGNLVFTGTYNHATNATLSNNGGTLTITGGFDISIGTTGKGNITGSGGLIKSGAGTLTLGGTTANSFTGATTVNAGTVVLNKTAGVNAIAGNITLGDGSGTDTLRLDADNQIINTALVTIDDSGRFNLNDRAETVFNVISASADTAAEIQFGTGALTVQPTAVGQYYGTMTGSAGSTFTMNGSGSGEFRASGTGQTFGFEKLLLQSGLYRIGHGTTLGQDTQLGAVPSSELADAITFNGGTLSFAGGDASTTITLNANRGITLNAGGGTLQVDLSNAVIPGKITGAGGLTKSSGLTLTLSNTGNDYLGATTIASSGGTLKLGAAGVIPDTSIVTVNTSGTFDLNGFDETIGGLAGAGSVVNNGTGTKTLTVNQSSAQTFSGSLSSGTGVLALTKAGAGLLTLSGSSSYTGTTTIESGGAIRIQTSASALGASGAGQGTTVNSGAQLQTSGSLTFPEPLTLNGTGISNDGTGALRVVANGPTFSGPITLGSSGVRIQNAGAAATITGGITGTNTDLALGGTFNWTVNTSSINLGSGTFTFDNTTAGNTLRLDTANTMGAFNYFGPIVKFNNSSAAGTGIITVGSAATEFSVTGGFLTVLANDIVLNTGANPQFYAASGGSLTLNGVISGAGSAQRRDTGAANPIINGANTFTGNFQVTSRGVTLGNKSALGAGTFIIGDGSAPANTILLQSNTNLTGANAIANAVTVNQNYTIGGSTGFEFAGNMTLAATRTVTVDNTAGAIISGDISGAGIGLTKAGPQKLTLTGGNTFNGSLSVNNGTLSVDSIDASPTNAQPLGSAGSAIIVGTSGSPSTLQYTGTGATLNREISAGGGATGGATIRSTTATLTLGIAGATMGVTGVSGSPITFDAISDIVVDSVVSGATSTVTKTGAGKLTLNATNTYTGNTTVSAGTLNVAGDISASPLTTVTGTGTLEGSGAVGDLKVENGGAVAPGNSPGILPAGDTEFASGGIYEWEISDGDAGGTPGTDWDLLDITGTLTISASSGAEFIIKVISSASVPNLVLQTSYKIAQTTVGITGFSASSFIIDETDFSDDNTGSYNFEVQQSGTNLMLVLVPEPTGSALLLLSGAVLLRRRRRR